MSVYRAYTITADGLTLVNAVVTTLFINPPASGTDIEMRRFWLGQSSSTTSAQQRVQIVTQPTSFPTVVSATPRPLKFNSPVSVITGATTGAAGTCGVNASAEGSGTKVVAHADVFNLVNGWLLVLTPEEIRMASAADASGVGMYLPVAASSLTNWTVGLTFNEK